MYILKIKFSANKRPAGRGAQVGPPKGFCINTNKKVKNIQNLGMGGGGGSTQLPALRCPPDCSLKG